MSLLHSSLRPAARTLNRLTPSVPRFTSPHFISVLRSFASSGGHDKVEVEARVLEVVKAFDKVDIDKVQLESHFVNDLGLDSLDTVEVVMAIEDEFAIEIPDQDADAIHTVKQAVDYILTRQDIS